MDNFYAKFKILLSLWNIMGNAPPHPRYQIVEEFEKKLAEFFELPYALGVASGTDALILSLKACGIGPGDEVIIPAISFFSTAAAPAWIGARPVFADIDAESLNIDPAKIEKVITPRTKAIIAVHLNGRMADMEQITALAKKKPLIVIEDAAHAFGSKYKGKPPGYYGDLACISFNPTKIFGGYGDGGAIITQHAELAEKINYMRRYGSRYQEFGIDHPVVGVASRLHPFQAAVLKAKLGIAENIIAQTRRNYFLYSELLKGIEGLTLSKEPEPEHFINGYRYPVFTAKRAGLRKFLRERGIDARFQYGVPLPFFEAWANLGYKKGDFPVAEKIADEVLCLPTGPALPESKIRTTAELIKEYFS